MKFPKQLKNKWVKALRSGKYTQAKGVLKRRLPGNNKYAHCCLGVLGELCGVSSMVDKPIILEKGNELRGITKVPQSFLENSILQDTLAEMNDDGYSFTEIADYIEKEL